MKSMLKKVICCIFVLTIMVSAFPNLFTSNTVQAASTYYPEYGIYFDTSTGTITDADANITSIVIPEKIDGFFVTKIGSGAFYNCSALKSITFPTSLTSISGGNYGTFAYCSNLETVVFNNSPATIGYNAFAGCSKLKTVSFGNSIKSIDSSAFSGCNSLTSISIPASLTSLAYSAFSTCSGLVSIEVSEDNNEYTTINGALYTKDGNTLIKYPALNPTSQYEIAYNTKIIYSDAFSYCKNIISLTIPETVSTIGNGAFYSSELQTVTIKNANTSIGGGAFRDCKKLLSINLGNGIKTIETAAFYNCTSLKSITFPASLTSISGGNYGTFAYCSNLETVVFNNSPATIGYNAFAGCSKLKTVSFGNSIKSIDSSAFSGCNSLTSISIPASLTSLAYSAFSTCSGLVSIEVSEDNNEYTTINGALYTKDGNTLIKYPALNPTSQYEIAYNTKIIYSDAFSYCKNIISLTIPETVSTIGNGAFYSSELQTVTIKNANTSIGGGAFRDCKKLLSINLGNGIKTIETAAFYNCTSLKSITFPASLTSISGGNYGTFAYCSNLETVVFNNSPATIGYNAFAGCSNLKTVSFGNSIKSIDSSAFSGCNSLTSISLPASVINLSDHAFSSCRNLHTIYGYTGSTAETYANNNGFKFVSLGYLGGGNEFTGTYKTNTTVIMQRESNVYDLLSEHQVFSKNSTEKVTIVVSPDWQGKAEGRILLSQGGTNCLESTTGLFENICPADIFDSDGKICVVLVTADGETIEFQPIQLQITSTENGSQTSVDLPKKGTIKLFEDFEVDVPVSVPIVGGSNYGISLGSLSTELEVVGNNFKATIGSTILEGKKGADGKWKKEDWQGLKTGFKDAKEKLTKGVSKNYNFLKNIASKKTSLELKNGVGADVSVVGYLEGTIDENGNMKIFEGGIIVAGKIKYTYQGMVVVGIAPLYYEVGAGGELEFVGGVKGYVPEEGMAGAFTGSLTPSVFVEAGGGVGIPYVMTAGAKGKAELALEVALERIYQKFTVKGSAKFQWKGPFNVVLYEKDFAKGTWYIYETGNPDTLLGSTVGLFSLRDIYNGIDLDSPVQLGDRKNTSSEWTGDINQNISLFSADYTNKKLTVLEQDSPQDIAPVIAYMNDKKVMAWITDNNSRESVNKSMLVYSVYDEDMDTWSLPVPVADNGTADFYPAVKDGYVVWQKANAEFDETASINDMSRSSEIYVAKWNGSGFDEAVRVTDNSTIDTKPILAVKNGVAHIIWTTNTEDNFMGTAGTNSILTCSFDGSNLSKQSTIASELTAITNMFASYTDALNVYYVTDTDNDYATVTDRDIYSLSGTQTTQLTSNSTLDSNPVAVEVNGEEWLFWYSEGNIMYKTATDIFAVFDNAQSGITDDFDVITNGSGNIVITWTTVNDGGAEIQGVFYDGETWSKDIQISEFGENVKYPHGLMDENGTVTLAFNRTQKIATDDYYTDGQADLCTLQVTPSYDITVDDAMLGSYELIVGENSLLVDIANKGELSVAAYTVEITDEKGNKLGEYVSETSLLAGEKKTIDVPFTIDETFTAQNIFATISAENVDEYNVDNNSSSVEVGSADAKIAGTAIGENKVSVTVKNAGFENVSGITVALSDGTSNTLQSKTIETIASKEATVVEFDIDLSALAFDEDGYGALTVTLNADADSNESNNETTINVSKSAIENYYEVKLHSVANTTKGCIINANVKNNLQYSRNATVIAAIYNSNNALVEVKMEEKELIADDYTTVDFNFEGVTLDKTQTIKLFIWDNLGTLRPIGIAKEYICSDYIK